MNFPSPVITVIPLSGGLHLVHSAVNSGVEHFGVYINAGSRDDPPGLEGLAHFVEHVLFKGTLRRRAWHIINRMEACGGELNAFTTKETTAVYSIFPYGNFLRAADLIADLVTHSTFPDSELDKERDVVADEISQYRDIPSEAVFDDFEDLLFAGSSLGHNILGNRRALLQFDSALCRRYIGANFTAGRSVVFYSGPEPADYVARKVQRLFSDMPSGEAQPQRIAPAPVQSFDKVVDLGHHQSNTVIGLRTESMFATSRWTMALLANIVGGPGMNSLLNVELRERRGLVYSVEAANTTLTDTGMFTIFFGCDHDDTDRCRRLITSTLRRIADRGLTPRFLAAAGRQYLGQLTLAADLREQSAMSMARSVLFRGQVSSRDEIADRILSVTVHDIRLQAENILQSGCSTLTLR